MMSLILSNPNLIKLDDDYVGGYNFVTTGIHVVQPIERPLFV